MASKNGTDSGWEKPPNIKKRSLIKRKSCSNSFNDSSYFANFSLNEDSQHSRLSCSFGGYSSSLFEESFTRGPLDLDSSINDSYPVDFSQLSSLCSSTQDLNTSKEKRSSTEIPNDLRLGTKIRVVSLKPFPWMSNTTATGSHSVSISEDDIDAAMRISMDNDSSIAYASLIPRTPLALLQASATYFQFPNFGSMPMFPRLDGTYKSRQIKMIKLQDLGGKCLESLVSEWSQSFDRLYQLWRKNRRHSFYLCAPAFSAFFTKTHERKETTQYNGESSDDDENRLRVIITPTSFGLRQLLREEGIEYSLPLRVEAPFINLTQEDCPKDFLPVKQGVTDDLDHDEWLKEIGISPRTTLKFSRSISAIEESKSKKRLYTSSQPENRQTLTTDEPEDSSRSTISIKGHKNIEKFYNILCGSKIAFSKTGAYAGLPPTLLASAPFYKSVSRELNMMSQVTKKDGELKYILELDGGPILPFVPKMLVDFVKALGDHNNKLLVQVNGRSSYSGFNEGVDVQNFSSVSEFEVDLLSDTFSW